MADLLLLSCMDVASPLPVAPWLELCQAIGSQVRRDNSSGGVHPALPVCRKTQLHLLVLSGIKKSEGNCAEISSDLFPDVYQLLRESCNYQPQETWALRKILAWRIPQSCFKE